MARFFLLFCFFLNLAGRPGQAALIDHNAYDEILHRYVDEEGYVDYVAIRDNSQSALESYLERLADTDLSGWPYKEKLAFWINAYNAQVIESILQRPGLKKTSDQFVIFNKPFKIAGQSLSLNDIEYRILRGKKNPETGAGSIPGQTLSKFDARIHFALARGAIGSPRLRNFAYTAENVERILQANAVYFANSSKYVDAVNGAPRLSKILPWSGKEFDSMGGPGPFLAELLDSEKRGDADRVHDALSQNYAKAVFVYDWSVNDRRLHPEEP